MEVLFPEYFHTTDNINLRSPDRLHFIGPSSLIIIIIIIIIHAFIAINIFDTLHYSARAKLEA